MAIGILNGNGIDITNTKSPSLRDLVKADGSTNGAFMHTANLNTLQNVLGHYGSINLSRKYQSRSWFEAKWFWSKIKFNCSRCFNRLSKNINWAMLCRFKMGQPHLNNKNPKVNLGTFLIIVK
jgi:cytochrome c peroxidase